MSITTNFSILTLLIFTILHYFVFITTDFWLVPPESNLPHPYYYNVSARCDTSYAPSMQLFNIADDPLETCNLARQPEYVPIILDLLRRLQKYHRESEPVYFPDVDFNANPEFHGGVWRPWLDDDMDTFARLHRVWWMQLEVLVRKEPWSYRVIVRRASIVFHGKTVTCYLQ